MKEHEKSIPSNEPATSGEPRSIRESGTDASAKTIALKETGMGELVAEAGRLGVELVREIFTKTPAPTETLGAIPARNPAAEAQISVQALDVKPHKTGRSADRNLDTEDKVDIAQRERWGTLFVLCAFAVGLAGGVGFVFAYWLGANNLVLGATLGFFFGGFGVGLVLYAHWLTIHKEATEPREVLPSSTAERDATWEDYCSGAHEVHRRGILKAMGALGAGVFAAMVLSLMRSLGMSPNASLFTTVWKPGQRLMTADGKPMTVDSLRTGGTVTVFPEDSIGSERSQTVLIRVKEQLLDLPKGREDWAPKGYVAYSRVCTHAGCPVGMFEADINVLLCPCHQSSFDVLRGAAPTGGPAARPLPQLPLYADSDGNLRAGGGFTAPPGPGFWGWS